MKSQRKLACCLLPILLFVIGIHLSPADGQERGVGPDILITDFESKDYGEWQVQGEAFGTGPAEGALDNQMQVSGFKGKRLVNSFSGGDLSVGSLKSPLFEIKRDYLTFLVGGGNLPELVGVELLLTGKAGSFSNRHRQRTTAAQIMGRVRFERPDGHAAYFLIGLLVAGGILTSITSL